MKITIYGCRTSFLNPSSYSVGVKYPMVECRRRRFTLLGLAAGASYAGHGRGIVDPASSTSRQAAWRCSPPTGSCCSARTASWSCRSAVSPWASKVCCRPLALRYSDRACVMRRGRIVLSGTSADLRSDPDALRDSYLGTAC